MDLEFMETSTSSHLVRKPCTTSFFNWTLSRSLTSRRASSVPRILKNHSAYILSPGFHVDGSIMGDWHHLEHPNMVLSRNSDLTAFAKQARAQNKQPSCIWLGRSLRGLYFSDVFGFRALFCELCACVFGCVFVFVRPFVVFVFVFVLVCAHVPVFVLVFVCSCARVSEFIFVFCGCNFW